LRCEIRYIVRNSRRARGEPEESEKRTIGSRSHPAVYTNEVAALFSNPRAALVSKAPADMDFLPLPPFLPEIYFLHDLQRPALSRISLARSLFPRAFPLACGFKFNPAPHPIATSVRSHFVIRRIRSHRCLEDITSPLSCSNDSSARYAIINNDFIVIVKSILAVQVPMATKVPMRFTTSVYEHRLIQPLRHLPAETPHGAGSLLRETRRYLAKRPAWRTMVSNSSLFQARPAAHNARRCVRLD